MILALGGLKGGIGRSTLAISLAVEWHRRGRRTLLIDADGQGSARTWAALSLEAGHTPPTVVSMSGRLDERGQVPRLAEGFERVVIDLPPRDNVEHRSGLVVADAVLIPCGPAPTDLWALAEAVTVIEKAREVNRRLRAAVVLNRRPARAAIGDSARAALTDCGLSTLPLELGMRVAYPESIAAGSGPTVYAPTSSAAGEVRSLADALEKLTRGSHGNEKAHARRTRATAGK